MERIKLAILNKFIEILPLEDSYFISVDRPKTRLTKQLVLMNYAHMSIYKNTDLIFCADKNKLYIWFYKKTTSKNKLLIPEGYLWFKLYKHQNTILEIQKANNTVFLVIKDGLLMTQVIKTKKADKGQFIMLLQKKYHIDEPPIIPEISVSSAVLTLSDIFKFINPATIRFDNLFNQAVEFLSLPLITAFFLMSLGNIAYYNHVKSTLQSKSAYLMELKKKNSDIKQKFRYLEEEQKFWQAFKANEMKYPTLLTYLNIIAKTLLQYNGHINMLQAGGDTITMWAYSESSSSVVKDLIKTGLFTSVNIVDVIQKKSGEIAQLELRLKPLW